MQATYKPYSTLAYLIKSKVVNLITLRKCASGDSSKSMLRIMLTRYKKPKAKSRLSNILLIKSATSYKTFVMLLIPTIRRSNAAS